MRAARVTSPIRLRPSAWSCRARSKPPCCPGTGRNTSAGFAGWLPRTRTPYAFAGRAAPAALLLRAHALERLGHHDEALPALRAYPLHRVYAKVAEQFAALRPAERASAAYAAEQAMPAVAARKAVLAAGTRRANRTPAAPETVRSEPLRERSRGWSRNMARARDTCTRG